MCRSTDKIKNLKLSDDAAILNDESAVSKLNHFDINFRYPQIECKESF